MRNYFQVVGPEDDPADVAGAASFPEAFERIADSGATFISRGDASGTHKRELSVWEGLGIDPVGQSWYRESAAGQGQTLTLANDDDAYTLVDNSTFATFADALDIVELLRDSDNPNVYSVVRLNAERLDEVNAAAGDAWLDFMTGAAQQIIADYGREEYGEPLFEPLP
jgi:tungstate transport system substrate-binding protein